MSPEATHALSRAAGLDLAAYRADHVASRVRRAMLREGVPDEEHLARLLRRDAGARGRFRRSIAISVSGLFRDAAQFELPEQRLLPPIPGESRRMTVWSAGCADGSEIYSVALLLERLGALDRSLLLGSDVLEENLAAARRGVFGDFRVPEHVLARIRWELRDLLRDGPPPGRWRLILCRNVAIYLAPAARRALHEAIAASLAAGGVLLLGRSERLADPRSLELEPVGPHAYRRSG